MDSIIIIAFSSILTMICLFFNQIHIAAVTSAFYSELWYFISFVCISILHIFLFFFHFSHQIQFNKERVRLKKSPLRSTMNWCEEHKITS